MTAGFGLAVSIVLGVLAAAVVTGETPTQVAADGIAALVDVVDRGARLTRCTVNASGVVQETPEQLAAAAGAVVGRDVSTDANSLARMVRSEEGRAGQLAKNYLCHVGLNQAAAAGWTVTQWAAFHTTAARSGHYGKQISGRVATIEDPYTSDLDVAEHALAERAAGLDPTGGATNFVDTGAFGVQEGTRTFEDVRSEWEADGKVFGRLSDTPGHLVFAWAGSLPDVAEALA